MNHLSEQLTSAQGFSLTLAVAFASLAHFGEIPIWCTILAVLCLIYRLGMDFGRELKGWYVPKLRLRLLNLFCLALTGLIYLEFETFRGPEPASAFIAVLAGLKLLESRSYRDGMVIILLTYILLMTWLLLSQTLISTIFVVLNIFYSTSLLIQLNSRHKTRLITNSRLALWDALRALPILLLMFFIFPRFSLSFTGGASDEALTGFTGDLDPGSVSRLQQSDEVAFRVRFLDDQRPILKNLYWRGSVLTEHQGLRWKSSKKQWNYTGNISNFEEFNHEVLLEPRNNRWVFGLDRPVRAKIQNSNMPVRWTKEGEMNLPYNITQRTIVKIVATKEADRQISNPQDLLTLHEKPSKSFLKLAESFKEGAENSLEIASRALKFFRSGGFSYSLEPGGPESQQKSDEPIVSKTKEQTSNSEIDTFLFKYKKGFCEHYAATFALLMRAAGVPSRIIVGYYGGLYNELGSYLIVRDREAHAWVEIWLGDQWMRIDPTVSVSPERIQMEQINSAAVASYLKEMSWHEKASLALDYVDNTFALFMLNYDYEKQLELLQNYAELFGISDLNRTQMAIIVFLFILIAYLAATRIQWSPRPNIVDLAYDKLLARAKSLGVPIDRHLGPGELFSRLNELPHSIKQDFIKALETYALLKYYSQNQLKQSFLELVAQIPDNKKTILT